MNIQGEMDWIKTLIEESGADVEVKLTASNEVMYKQSEPDILELGSEVDAKPRYYRLMLQPIDEEFYDGRKPMLQVSTSDKAFHKNDPTQESVGEG